jgi:arylsulfatase A-like enzyme
MALPEAMGARPRSTRRRGSLRAWSTAALVIGLLMGALPTSAADDPDPARPHILYLLADDLGWADVGFHGARIETPNIDRLAAAGARLEQFYVQPMCSPTRAALLTGRYPFRQGLQVGAIRPWARYGLPLDERTLPQALKEVGYVTAIVGKWHLGHFRPEYLPTRRGFDRQYGHYNGSIDYETHRRDGGLDWHRDDRACHDRGYSTFLIADEAARIIDAHDPATPLFLYVPFNAVHAPYQVPEAYTQPYRTLSEPRRTYAGMVAAMDHAIGTILAALERKKIRRHTLIVFSSDNGGPAPDRITRNAPLRGGKGTLYEGGVRVPATVTWEGRIEPGSVVNEPLHVVDWYPTLLKLAGASLAQKHPVDGRDAWPAIAAGKPSPHAEIPLNVAPQGGAIRVGHWKLVLNGQRGARADDDDEPAAQPSRGKPAGENTEQAELFDLARDPFEQRDRSAAEPEKMRELRARYDAFVRQAIPPPARPAPKHLESPAVWGE